MGGDGFTVSPSHDESYLYRLEVGVRALKDLGWSLCTPEFPSNRKRISVFQFLLGLERDFGPFFLFEPSWKKNGAGFRENSWIKIKNFANPVLVRGNSGVHKDRPYPVGCLDSFCLGESNF